MFKRVAAGCLIGLLLVGCASGSEDPSNATVVQAEAGQGEKKNSEASAARSTQRPQRVDPRARGFEIGLGEWAVTPEAEAIRPGPVTFVIENRGTMGHGFEIELEGDSSGHGSGDGLKAESNLLQPGDSTRMELSLAPGIYKIECLVEGHDDMGMEGLLEVRAGAPFPRSAPAKSSNHVAIADFSFSPDTTQVSAGTEVTWHNEDPTEHTVTAVDGDFGSEALGSGQSFTFRFDEPGRYAYFCEIHPDMTAVLSVE
jgi:plastocyanin